MSSLVLSLVVIVSALTAVGVVLYIYRARLAMDEENTLILTDAEAHLVAGQGELHAKMNRLGVMLKYTGIAWVVFGVAALLVWLGEGAGLL